MPTRSTHAAPNQDSSPCQDPYGQCSTNTQVAECDPARMRSVIMQGSRQPTATALAPTEIPFSAAPEQKLGVTHTTKEGLTLSRGPNGELRATIENQHNDLGIGYVRKNGAYSTDTHWTKIYDQVPGGSSRLNGVKMSDTYSLDVVHHGEGRTTLLVNVDRSVEAIKIQVGKKVYLLRESDIKDLDTKTNIMLSAATPTVAVHRSNAAPTIPPPAQLSPIVTPEASGIQGSNIPIPAKVSPKTPTASPEVAKPAEVATEAPKGSERVPIESERAAVEPKVERAVERATETAKSETARETPETRITETSEVRPEVEAKPEASSETRASNTDRSLTVEERSIAEVDARTSSAETSAAREAVDSKPVKAEAVEVGRTTTAEAASRGAIEVEATQSASGEPTSSPADSLPAERAAPSTDAISPESTPTESVPSSDTIEIRQAEAGRTAPTEAASGVTDTSPSTTVVDAPAEITSNAPVHTEPSVNSRLLEGFKRFNQNVKVSEWARNNQFKAMTYAAAMSEAVTGAMRAKYEPNDPHSPVPVLLTLLDADIQKGFEFTTKEGGLAASVAAEASRSAGDATLAFGGIATLDAGLTKASTTRIGQALGGRAAASALSRTLGVVGIAYHGYSTFSDGSFVHQNNLQLAGSTASPVVMGAIIGAPLGPVGAGGGAVLGAGSEAVGVAVGYSRLKGQIEADWKKREVREALRLAEEGFILPSDDARVTSRKPFEQLPSEHQEVLTDVAKLATLARLTRELGRNDLEALGFKPEPGANASAEERNRIGTHNWERMIQLTEGRAGYNPYRLLAGDYVDELRSDHPWLAKQFEHFYTEAKDHYKNLYNHAPHVTYNLTDNSVAEDSELLKYIPEVVRGIPADAKGTEVLKHLETAFPGIEIIMQNPRVREKLTNYLENESGNTGRFRRLFDLEELPLAVEADVPLGNVRVRKKDTTDSSKTSFSLAV